MKRAVCGLASLVFLTGLGLVPVLQASANGDKSDCPRKEGERQAEKQQLQRQEYERKGGDRKDVEKKILGQNDFSRRAELLAGLLRTEAEVSRLRNLLRKVQGVTNVTTEPGEQAGLIRTIVTVTDAAVIEQALKVTRNAGIETDFVQWLPTEKVRDGDGKPRDGEKQLRDGEKKLREGDGKYRPAETGFPSAEGKYRPAETGFPKEGKFRPDETGAPKGEGKYRPAETGFSQGEKSYRDGEKRQAARTIQIAAGPIRNNQEAFQLRRILLEVEGVRDVNIQPAPQRPTIGIIGFTANDGVVERALRAIRGVGLEAKLLTGETDKRDGYKRDGDKAGPRYEGEKYQPRKDGDKPREGFKG